MSIAIVSLIVLVVIAIIAIPILIRVFGEAVSRNPNRAEDEDDRERQERRSGEQEGPGSST